MPSQPIATWITPCSSRRVHVLGTSRRRQIIGLIPSTHTLSRTTPSLSGGGRSGGFVRDDRFGGIIRPVYCPAPQRASRGYAHPSLRDCPTLACSRNRTGTGSRKA